MSVNEKAVNNKEGIAVIGLGYVGLPLAVAFAQKSGREVVGFDIDERKIREYKEGIDRTESIGEAVKDSGVKFTTDENLLESTKYFFVTVPTPTIKGDPDLKYLAGAIDVIIKHLKKGDYVTFESTVFPTYTREVAIPLLEQGTGLTLNEDFYVGFSPERINPGDTEHTLDRVAKVVGGSSQAVAEHLGEIYRPVVGSVFLAESLEVAEACKILENSQRDVNIALINQFAMLYPEIPTHAIVEAMNTKWNALKFKPGLVGGHCIAEDPYYLMNQVFETGERFTILEESRTINRQLLGYIIGATRRKLDDHSLKGKKILMKGATFKENLNDVRNSLALELVEKFQNQHAIVDICDPIADRVATDKMGLTLLDEVNYNDYDIIIYAVKHNVFKDDLQAIIEAVDNPENLIMFDIQAMFRKDSLRTKFRYIEL
ncbi:MAG: nucleotide sugar dehydrogenase [Mycoplasmatales bacterium]